MLSLLFVILMVVVFWNILKFAVKATWGVSKIVFNLILLPICLIGLLIKGMLSIAFPLLIVIAVISFFVLRD